MVDGFAYTHAAISRQLSFWSFNSRHWRGVLYTTLSDKLCYFRYPPTIKLTSLNNLNVVESGTNNDLQNTKQKIEDSGT
jgi:hypothetical protein